MDRIKNLTKPQIAMIGGAIVLVVVSVIVVLVLRKRKENTGDSSSNSQLTNLRPNNYKTGVYYKNLSHEAISPLTKSNRNLFLVYYGNWCGHCVVSKPIVELTARIAKELGSDFVFAGIESEEVGKLGTQGNPYPIRGFPTFHIYTSGSSQPVEYTGPRNVKSFLQALNVSLPDDSKLLQIANKNLREIDLGRLTMSQAVTGQ